MRKSEYPKVAKTFGQKIRKKRMDLKLSLLDVANKAGITESYLSRIEADKQRPSPQIAVKIAEAIHEPAYLFYMEMLLLGVEKTTWKSNKPTLEQLIKSPPFLKKFTQNKK